MQNEDLWYKDAVFYEVYIRAFADGNGDGKGDFPGLTSRLDYIQSLGVDCIWLLPMYPSPLVDDGYDIADYRSVHPDYGTLADFKEFLDQAHARGLRVIADLVLNHTSDQHPWFVDARSSRESASRDYYLWSDSEQKFAEARIIFIDSQKSNWAWDPVSRQYYFHRFFPQQPDLNYDNPRVRQEMIDIMRSWMDLGLDGFRADAVPYLIKREGTNCENLPETHQYLKELRRAFDAEFPGRVLLAEANQWPAEVRAYFGDGDEFQMAFDFPVMPRIYIALAREDARPIVEIMQATPQIPPNCQWCTFLRNHDELTLEMVTPEERDYLWRTYAPVPRMRLNLGIRRRLAPLLGGDRRKIELLNSLLFTLPGSPIIYYGDEIGMGDDIWLKDRDGVRTPMQWDAGPNAGFSSADPGTLYAKPIEDETFGYAKVNVAVQQVDPQSLWHTIRGMIAVRKAHPAFGRGDLEFINTPVPALLAFYRSYQGDRILALHNLSASPHIFDLQSINLSSASDLLTGAEFRNAIRLSPFQYLWLHS